MITLETTLFLSWGGFNFLSTSPSRYHTMGYVMWICLNYCLSLFRLSSKIVLQVGRAQLRRMFGEQIGRAFILEMLVEETTGRN